jgi:murein DD-endopeptidase MepM/ murein hydrolase activator NlpD
LSLPPPAPEERGTVAEAVPPTDPRDAEHPNSFDPGPETGYVRRGRRDHELPLEIGAAPFDPGPERYDTGRAKRSERRRRKAERKRRNREQHAQEKRERKRLRAEEKQERDRLQAVEMQERERLQAAERDQRERAGQEREHREQAAALESRRQQARQQQSEKAERARVERERIKREQRPEPHKPKRIGRPLPAPAATPAAGTLPRRPEASLRGPTAKAGLALVVMIAIAAGAGSLLGLPVPGLDREPGSENASAAAPVIDAGTPTGLTKGPYHPVVGEVGYAEAAAKFGAPRSGRKHEGQDIFAKPGTPLVAVRDGVVVDGGGGGSFYSGGGGNTLVIYSPIDDRSYVYLHMLKPAKVVKGESVKAGQLVGQLGCTGSCDGPHLHFEIRQGRAVFGPQKKAVDPLPLLRQWPLVPTS